MYSGGVAIHEKQTLFLIDNVTDGFSLHSMESGNLVRSYPTKPTISKAKQVAFGEKGAIVIGGGEDGKAHIFDRKSGTRLQCLQHAKEGLVQTIAVCSKGLIHCRLAQLHPGYDGSGHSIIITATSSSVPNPTIAIWKRSYRKIESAPATHKNGAVREERAFPTFNEVFTTIVRLLLVSILLAVLINVMVCDVWANKIACMLITLPTSLRTNGKTGLTILPHSYLAQGWRDSSRSRRRSQRGTHLL